MVSDDTMFTQHRMMEPEYVICMEPEHPHNTSQHIINSAKPLRVEYMSGGDTWNDRRHKRSAPPANGPKFDGFFSVNFIACKYSFRFFDYFILALFEI